MQCVGTNLFSTCKKAKESIEAVATDYIWQFCWQSNKNEL